MHAFSALFRRWRYLFLLGAILALLVLQPIATDLGLLEMPFELLLVVVMAVLALALGQDRIWRNSAIGVCVAVASLSIAGHFLSFAGHSATVSAGQALGALFFLLVAARIVRSIFNSHEISPDSICGTICGYMLLGIAWGLTYSLIDAVDPASFRIGDAMQPHMQQIDDRRSVFMYYSFITLTTVGYGDITPISTTACTLAWSEAVFGQLYLAVLVAGLMSALVARNNASGN